MAAMSRHSFNIEPYGSEHIMGPGSHVGFPISAKNKNLVYDHPMTFLPSLVQICFVVSETRGSGEPVSLT
jgi:hypothetical protein